MITFLEGALEFAEQLGDGTTAHLIERALNEARAQQFSGIANKPADDLH
jgi:hypothetical protein